MKTAPSISSPKCDLRAFDECPGMSGAVMHSDDETWQRATKDFLRHSRMFFDALRSDIRNPPQILSKTRASKVAVHLPLWNRLALHT